MTHFGIDGTYIISPGDRFIFNHSFKALYVTTPHSFIHPSDGPSQESRVDFKIGIKYLSIDHFIIQILKYYTETVDGALREGSQPDKVLMGVRKLPGKGYFGIIRYVAIYGLWQY